MAPKAIVNDEEAKYEVSVVAYEQVTVTAGSRQEAKEKARDELDMGELATDLDEYRVERPDVDETLYNVYKNGELVEENKAMSDHKANKLDGHTQFNKEEKDFEKFRVEEV